MRSGNASRQDRLVRHFYRELIDIRAAGLCRIRVEDELLVGGSLVIEGKRMLNFGSAAYLGLNTDSRLKAGAIAAIERFGPVFSSSTAYTSVDLYTALEERLAAITGGVVIVPTTTTLGHLAALPILINDGDSVLVDAQAHATVHLATQVLQAAGIPVEQVPHNDMGYLEAAVAGRAGGDSRVWYLADGLYSMFGDTAPVEQVMEIMDRHQHMHAYFDDAHGFGWHGVRGRGIVLERAGWHPRLVVAMSLAKSWGSGGAVLAFPADSDIVDVVQMCGTTLGFSGPLHPAELGASVAAADIHLSAELPLLHARLQAQIELMEGLLRQAGLPVMAMEKTPLWFVRVGNVNKAIAVARKMMDRGFFLNIAAFPLVPYGQAGLRFTHTLYHTSAEIESMVEALAATIREVVGGTEIVIDLTAETPATTEAAGPPNR
jgi:7-keto-8-aminopelargonate synthetase-like enzyme